MTQIVGTIIEPADYDHSNHIPLVLHHWEKAFRLVYHILGQEAKKACPSPPGLPRYCVENAYYAFEEYQIVLELDSIGTPFRIYFPDEATELMMLLRA